MPIDGGKRLECIDLLVMDAGCGEYAEINKLSYNRGARRAASNCLKID